MAAESSSSLPPLIIESDDEVEEVQEEIRSTPLPPKDPQYPHKQVYCGSTLVTHRLLPTPTDSNR
jgi:hypothetical protein